MNFTQLFPAFFKIKEATNEQTFEIENVHKKRVDYIIECIIANVHEFQVETKAVTSLLNEGASSAKPNSESGKLEVLCFPGLGIMPNE